jgi:hypothetical protein
MNTDREQQRKQSRWGFRGKTFWDWMQLFIVPLMLVIITIGFSYQQNVRQQKIEDQRAAAERELAEQRAQDEALQAYLDQMSTLLLEKDLRNSEEGSEVRILARARTWTVLRRLGSSGKGTVVQFLYEAGLIKGAHPVISLYQADLSNAYLDRTFLSYANLSYASGWTEKQLAAAVSLAAPPCPTARSTRTGSRVAGRMGRTAALSNASQNELPRSLISGSYEDEFRFLSFLGSQS